MDSYILGITIGQVSDIETNPEIKFKFSDSEMGPSGGLMMSLAIYDALTEGKADAALAASLFHFKELEIMDLKSYLRDRGLSMRI